MLVAILVAEVLFWVVLAAGLAVRYLAGRDGVTSLVCPLLLLVRPPRRSRP